MTVARDLDLKRYVRDIPDFPKKGIVFKDITPVLKDPEVFRYVIERMRKPLSKQKVDYVAAIESRGFIFGSVLAHELGVGLVPIRKFGKLPYLTERVGYSLEYGEAVLEIHQDAVERGSPVVILDDLLATGGTALAAAQLIEKLGGKVAKIAFVIELAFLKGREKLSGYDVLSLIQY